MKHGRLLALLAAAPVVAMAQTSHKLDDIQVFDHREDQNLVDFIPSVTQLKGKELQKRRQTNIGETLQQEAGVNSTNFGPHSGRPVIRGLDGDRIKILQNSLGTMDASTQSLDHAIPVDMLTIDQVEVVRGPMSLLYGSSAVGGVVNLVTNRIHSVYEEGFFSQALFQGESAFNGLSSAAHLNYGKNKWMFHADASTRNFTNQNLPKHVKGGNEEKKGELPNSANQQDNLAVGVSRILDRGYYGLSFNHFTTEYGSVADEEVTIDMTQNRFEFHGEWRPEGNTFRKFKFKSAQSDYYHKEIEGGETGTTFRNVGNDSRFEAIHNKGNLDGVVGLQAQFFHFSAKGEEAFLPKNDNERFALFTYQEYRNGQQAYSAGARVEAVKVEKKSSDEFGAGDDKKFTTYNASLGHQYKFNHENSLSTTFSFTERAPNFQELYADGPHLATGSFEEGDDSLRKEKAYALEVNFKRKNDKSQFQVSAYTQIFKDYIALNPTGDEDPVDNLPIYKFEQVDALFYGADLDFRYEIAHLENEKGILWGITKADWVRARDTDSGDDLPRISPARLTLGLEYIRKNWTTDAEIQYVAHQTKTSEFEKSTDSFYQANLGIAYNIVKDSNAISFFGRVRNLFDVEARNHVSFVKEIAPLPGRNFILGAQLQL
jgi:iron complex outermembrane recepter protein